MPGLLSMVVGLTEIEAHYRYAGTCLSADFAFPELHETKIPGRSDFRIGLRKGSPPASNVLWSHDFPDPLGKCTLSCERTATDLRMHFPGVATVVAAPAGMIHVYPQAGACIEAVRHVLLDQALPRLLAQRGELVLHAAVVGSRSGKTLLLIGDSGRGKSTLTGAFLANGRTVGTDDGALVRARGGVLEAIPMYPSLRLLPDSRAHLFFGPGPTTLPVADYSEKRRLPVPGAMGSAHVDAIVLLDPPADGDQPRLSREAPGLACMALIRNGFQLDLSDTANLKALLAKAAEAARLVPVYRLEYPRRYEVLPDVLALLEAEA